INKRIVVRTVTAIVLIAFAAITLFMSGTVLFDWFGIRAEQRNYVPFIVWINFAAGFLYLISAFGLLKAQNWSFKVLIGTTLPLLIALIALVLFINLGGVYELKP